MELDEIKKQYPETPLNSRSKNLAGMKIGKLTVLYKTLNRGKRTSWVCKCECGNYTQVTTDHLQNRHTKSCGCLQKEKASQIHLKDEVGNKYGMLTVLSKAKTRYDYGYPLIYWTCKCDCGNIVEISGNCLRRERNVKSCGCLKHRTLINNPLFQNRCGKTYGQLQVLKIVDRDKNQSGAKYEVKCLNCGTITIMNGASLDKNKSCGCIKSYGEFNIKVLFNKHDINFSSEHTIIINNIRFRFDFFVDNKYFVEFDGIQHFNYKNDNGWNSKENYESTHQRDLIKNRYCFENNIPIIRIPYDAEYTIDDLKLETTRFLLTPENEKEYYESRK